MADFVGVVTNNQAASRTALKKTPLLVGDNTNKGEN